MSEKAYSPCRNGLHVCGILEDEGEFYTHANYRLSADRARLVFAEAKSELEDQEDGDFVVDLMINGDTEEDFFIRRQMLTRLSTITEDKP